jgi:catechol 2,3-dioxygenase
VRLSHVEFTVRDLASRAFYVDTLGLQVTDETADTIYLRAMEERGHHCIVLKKGETATRDLGFKVFDEDDLDKAEHFFKGKGLPVEWVERPYQSRTLRTRIRTAFRWNSTPRWTGCRRSIRNTRSTRA